MTGSEAKGILTPFFGDVAQLGERVVCNHEVRGSIPLISTRKKGGLLNPLAFADIYT